MVELWTIITFQAGYNTTIVLIGAILLGIVAGTIGSFVLLRKRALISDAASHATLPGIACGFLLAYGLEIADGRSLPILLLGAGISGFCGIVLVQWITDNTRLPEDAAIGTVLSVFFGLGMVLLTMIQNLEGGNRAGLNSFLLGQIAALSRDEVELIAIAATIVLLGCVVLFKRFTLLCFDPEYVKSLGWSTRRLDLMMMILMLIVLCIGLKTVGLVLIIALLIIPPVAARFWTDRAQVMIGIAGLIGGLSSYLATSFSAMLPHLPTGAVIVLTTGGIFILSLLFAPTHGMLARMLRLLHYRLTLSMYHALLVLHRDGSVINLFMYWYLRRLGYVDRTGTITTKGSQAAIDRAYEMALWQDYLNQHPEEAMAYPDWGIKRIEDVLPVDVINTLKQRLKNQHIH